MLQPIFSSSKHDSFCQELLIAESDRLSRSTELHHCLHTLSFDQSSSVIRARSVVSRANPTDPLPLV